MLLVSLWVLIPPRCLICSEAHFGWGSREKRGGVGVLLKNNVLVTKQVKPHQASSCYWVSHN